MEILIKPFFLPVVRPFGKNVKIIPKPWKLKETLDYYKDLESKGVKITTTLSTSASPLEIRIQNHTTKHPAPDDDPVSTIFSMTSGFVSLIPEGLVLRVWTNDFKELTKTPRKPSRANRIVYGNIDLNSIKEKIKIQIEKLGLGVLKESAGATSTQDPQELANKFLERFMKGEVEVFVFAGTVLGRATEIPNTLDAMLTLQTFFDPAGAAPPERVVPEDLIDNAFRWQQLHAYMGHPLLTALNAPVSITFQSRFFIWDTGKYEYAPLVSTEVELFVGPDLSNIPNLDQIADLKNLAVAGRCCINDEPVFWQPAGPVIQRSRRFLAFRGASFDSEQRTLTRAL